MKKLKPIYALFITLFLLYAFSANPPNGRTGAPGEGKCTDCHATNNSGFEGMVGIQGLPAVIMPNTTYNLSVVTKVITGNPNRSGFQLVILDDGNGSVGTLANAGASSTTTLSGGKTYFEHNPAQSFGTVDSVAWTVDWTSPNSISGDSVIIYVNSIIGNGIGNSGDLMVSNRTATSFQGAVLDPVIVSISNSSDVSCFGGSDGTATASASGGNGNITFAWSNDSAGATISNLSMGTYLVTASDTDGNSATASIMINQPSQLMVDVSNQINIDCNNTMGTATVIASGGTPDYTYGWSSGDSSNVANLSSGTFTVTATDANQCTATTTVTISEDTRAPLADAGFDIEINCNSPTTAIQLDGRNSSTGTGVQYLWTTTDGHIVSGDSTLMPIVDSAGAYILMVTNTANGCATNDTVVITHNLTLPEANAGTTMQLDCGTTELTLNGTGSTGDNITYLWTTSDGNIIRNDSTLMPVISAAGTYTLTVTNTANGCSSSASVNITQDANMPNASAGETMQLDCNNNTVTLNGSGSTGASISYLWTTVDGNIVSGDSTLTPVADSAGTYTLTITNLTNSCSATSSVIITEDFTLPTADAGVAMQLDCGATELTLNGTGSTGDNITYLWTTSDGNIIRNDSTLMPVINAAGTYTLDVANITNGCSSSASVIITQNINMPIADAGAMMQLDCNNGTVTLNGNGSIGDGITYFWATLNGNIVSGDSTLTPIVDAAGIYTFSVTNNNNACSATDTVVVTQDANAPNANAGETMQLDCNNDTVTLNGSGSTGDNIVYSWTTEDGNITSGASTLAATIDQAGTYTLTVTDTSNACSAAAAVTISNNRTAPIADAGAGKQLACGDSTISLDGSSSSIGIDISYQWSTENGNIVSGGNTTTPVVDAAGTYILTVLDATNGCSATASVSVTTLASSDIFAASGDADQLTCNKSIITLSGSGSEGDHIVYEWSTENGNILEGTNTLTPSVDAPGKYTLTVRDTSSGCFAESFINISQDDTAPGARVEGSQQLDCNTTSTTLNGHSDAIFHLSYQWTTEDGNIISGASTQTPLINASGTYSFTVTDTINGCSSTASITISQDAALPAASAGPSMQLDCNTDTLTLNGSGSTGDNFTYLWTTADGNIIDGAATLTPRVDAPGSYTLTVTDTTSGCANTASVAVNMNVQQPIANAGANQQMICANSTITLNGSGSIGDNFTYFWCTQDGSIVSGGETPTAIIDGPGLFEYIVTNTSNGCVSIDTVTVTEIDELVLTLDTTSAGAATVSATGGTMPYSYNWSTDPVQTESTVKGLLAGDYRVTVTDNNGCTDTLTVTIEISTGVADLDKELESLQIYPNPANAYFEIDLVFNRSQKGSILILNAIGQHQWQQVFNNKKLFYQIDTNDWLPGIYYLLITTEHGIKTEEIAIVR